MSAKPKSIRLSPNKRAELISRFEKGEKFDNEDYYVIKDKSGRLNVRKRKQRTDRFGHPSDAKQSESSSDDVKQETPAEPTTAPEATPAPKDKKVKEPKTKAL